VDHRSQKKLLQVKSPASAGLVPPRGQGSVEVAARSLASALAPDLRLFFAILNLALMGRASMPDRAALGRYMNSRVEHQAYFHILGVMQKETGSL
jgi:hypothetical protein